MKKSIKTRLVKNFMLVIVITVIILLIGLSRGIREYYYNNVEDIIKSQIEYSTDFYSRYFPNLDLNEIILEDVDLFWRYTDAQVQILDLEGEVLMDSIGVITTEKISTSDIINAREKEFGTWIGNVDYYDNPVMAVSRILRNQDDEIGIVRFIVSLEETNLIIGRIIRILILMGLVVISIAGLVSIFLANSIVKPLIEVTKIAEKMADGQLKIRSDIKLEDEIGQLSNTLNYMAEELLRKEEIKNDFISSVSHELRTPLTSIKGWAITLKAGVGEDKLLSDGLNIIENETDRLTKMVEELLDFSKFISGRISLEKEEFSIKKSIESIKKQYTPRASANSIELITNIDENVEMFVGDENRIKQVLINLLDNSIKFTPENGKIEICASEKYDNLIIDIIDNGVGISSEDIPHVKEKFFKGKNSKSNNGIGLSICDEIIKLHEGEWEIQSEENVGTSIKIILPLKKDVSKI